MKIINYNYGYNNTFNCSIHGKIVVTEKEWQEILKYLKSAKVKKSFLPSYPWTNSMLLEDIKRIIPIKRGELVNIRVPMTEKIVDKYNLKKYKRGNYMFLIVKHELKINSLHDGIAQCVCGWSIACTGERTRAYLRAEYQKHLK